MEELSKKKKEKDKYLRENFRENGKLQSEKVN